MPDRPAAHPAVVAATADPAKRLALTAARHRAAMPFRLKVSSEPANA